MEFIIAKLTDKKRAEVLANPPDFSKIHILGDSPSGFKVGDKVFNSGIYLGLITEIRVNRMVVYPHPVTKNARILVSRNKREGWYFGKMAPINNKHCRTWSKFAGVRWSRYPHSKVNFAELSIPLFNPYEAANGRSD